MMCIVYSEMFVKVAWLCARARVVLDDLMSRAYETSEDVEVCYDSYVIL